jgi:DNA-binding NtrC family response regulator
MRLLIIGKLGSQLVSACQIATQKGARVYHCVDIDSALHALRSGRGADLIMAEATLDIKQLIHQLAGEHIFLPVIACGVSLEEEIAVAAIKAGAKEYISLPPDEEIIAAMLSSIGMQDGDEGVIIASENMQSLFKMAERIANSEASVLITGESGTGKEVVAKFIHRHSKRASMPLISLNCAAIPENLLESELFGHEKGAFTGAIARRIGKFEESNNGTLFLDEISEMDIRLQAKLLRAIQEKVICRVGGNQQIKLNIRVIATSNKDLEAEVKKGNFREDLFYRLNVINISIPPLRQREDDISNLAHFFIKKYAAINGIAVKEISDEAMYKIMQHNWPGNVRELENAMHRALLLSSADKIQADDIMISASSNDNFVARTIDSVEQEVINKTLRYCNDNYSAAAKILGISIKNLRAKLQRYGQ